MANAKIEAYQQQLVDTLVKNMQSNPQFLKGWSNIPFQPYNGKNNTLYNGINQISLSMGLTHTQSNDPRFFTFKQIKDLGLRLNKGAKGEPVVYVNTMTKTIEHKGEEKEVKIPFMKITHAFNGKDIQGLEPYEKTKGLEALNDKRDLRTKLEGVIKNAGVPIEHGGNRAFYSGRNDAVMMPAPERFSNKEAYIATLLHELAHSTGPRQGRDMGGREWNLKQYAREELRAELSSVFMCQRLGIQYQLENDQSHIENSAAYLNSWIKMLQDDKNELFKAVTDASKITSYLIDGKSFEKDKTQTLDQQQKTAQQEQQTHQQPIQQAQITQQEQSMQQQVEMDLSR